MSELSSYGRSADSLSQKVLVSSPDLTQVAVISHAVMSVTDDDMVVQHYIDACECYQYLERYFPIFR